MADVDPRERLDPTEDDALRGICFCPTPYHAPFCRIGVMIARLAPPPDLRRINVH